MVLELVLKYRKRLATAGLLALFMVVVLAGRGGAQESPENYEFKSYQDDRRNQIIQTPTIEPDYRLPTDAGNYIRSNPELFDGWPAAWLYVESYDSTVTCQFTSDGIKWVRKWSDLCSKRVGEKRYDYYFGLPTGLPIWQEDYQNPNYTITYNYSTRERKLYELKTGKVFYDLDGKWVTEAVYKNSHATKVAANATLGAWMRNRWNLIATPTRPLSNSFVINTPTPNSTSVAATRMMAAYLTQQSENLKVSIQLTMDARNAEFNQEFYFGPDCYMDPYDPRCP